MILDYGGDVTLLVHKGVEYEKVARLNLDALGVRLTTLRKHLAEYLGVDVEGPYTSDAYRY